MASFGRYDVLDKLGEGAMGVVWRARDRNLSRVVALKMLSTELGDEDELHQRFHREAEAIGRLSHANIVSVYDLGEAEGRVYMAMELLEGEDLRNLIETQASVALAERVRILLDICAGLGYAHSRGVIHRDIKPANIMVTADGRVKLLDFGLARVATRETITRRGVILGTPDYMSPEQAMGKPVDHRTDVFSAGAVFYEFLTHQKPFKGKTLHSVLYQIISEPPDPVLTLNPEVPARLALVIHRMLKKDADGRYQTMDDVARDLRIVLPTLRRRGLAAAVGSPDELRARAREALARGRAHLEGARFAQARTEIREALMLEPDNEEAAEMLWRAERALRPAGQGGARDAEGVARVEKLLGKAAPGRPDDEAKRALAALALIAPDDPRLGDLLRERAGRG
jgi:eukaryotic-like serine/threonine-protein kinase